MRSKKTKRPAAGRDVPEGFTLSMAATDALPVAFFIGSAVLVGIRFPSVCFRIGALLMICAGGLKVLWKFIIALAHRNVPLLSRQFRYLMPAGFVLVLISLAVGHRSWRAEEIWRRVSAFPSVLFFVIALIGMVRMAVFAVKSDRTDARANWAEQCTNIVVQGCIFFGIWLM